MSPKQAGFIMPAEWFPHEACWMAWPCHVETWASIGLERAQIAYGKVASTIAQFEPVILLVNPGQEKQAQVHCSKDISILPFPLNDSWTRDTGPSFLLNDKGELAGVDWIHNAWGGLYPDHKLDDKIAEFILTTTKAISFKAPLVMEGGSFHVDGQGTLLTTRECLMNANRNPTLSQEDIEVYLADYLGISKIIWLNKGVRSDETDGHIDEIACFLAPGKVLALDTNDKQDENYAVFKENIDILKSVTDAQDRLLEVITLEQPCPTFLNGKRQPLSYINFYLANNALIMPMFGYDETDRAAFSLFSRHFPNRQIIPVNALDIFAGGGGIHCITQQQPITRPYHRRDRLK